MAYNEKFMLVALEEAKKAYNLGEIPVGAVITRGDEIIATAYNKRETEKNALFHAETEAIFKACKALGGWRLWECSLYVTLEPCMMCMGAILQSRISKLHIGTFNKDMGACGTILNIFDYDIFNSYVITNWCYNKECSELMSKFFYERRKQN